MQVRMQQRDDEPLEQSRRPRVNYGIQEKAKQQRAHCQTGRRETLGRESSAIQRAGP